MIPAANSVDIFSAFVGGVLVSFTPCVYPLIPVTAGYIGARGSASRVRGFLLSLAYVTGIAITYSLLGLIASLTGMLFGRISSHPVTYIVVGVLIIFFGISMWGWFDFAHPVLFSRLPWAQRMYQEKRTRIWSALFLGMASGLLIGPCMTPMLGTILTYIATKQNVVHGMLLLVSFAYGMGCMLILVGTFSSVAAGIPRSGMGMNLVKRAGASVLLIMGAYFVYEGIRRL
jgi:cytochrome c-type biogenesis protein